MAEAEGIPPTASVVSLGQSARYVGNYIYAYNYSGVTDSETTFFDFTSGMGIIKATLQAFSTDQSGNDFTLVISLNGEAVITSRGSSAQSLAESFFPIFLVIPPITQVKATLINNSASTSRDWWLSMTGRVYDA